MDIEWEDPPTANAGRPGARHLDMELAAALRENPGQWAKHPIRFSNASESTRMRNGTRAGFRPAGAFEVRTKKAADGKCDIWLRYVGEPS